MTITNSSNYKPTGAQLVVFEHELLGYTATRTVLDKVGAQTRTIPMNGGKVIEQRRPIPFDATTIPLVEGVTPNASVYRYETVTTTLQQFGFLTEFTDHLTDIVMDPIAQELRVQIADQAAKTFELLTWNVIKAGTQVSYTNGTARTDVNTPLSSDKLRGAVRTLQRQKAVPITTILNSSSSYGTTAVEAAYIAVGHTDLEHDIRGLPGFRSTADYGQRKTICDMELGSIENLRFVLSPEFSSFADGGGLKAGSGTTMVSTSGTSADVYPLLILGKESFGTTVLRGPGAISPRVLMPNQIDKSDPMGQRGTIAWKAWHAATILNQAWQVRLECAATAL